MFSFGANEDSVSYAVLIDISSGSVGIALAMSDSHEGKREILYSDKVSMRVTKHGNEDSENLRRIKETLFSAALTLSQEGVRVLHEHDSKAHIGSVYVTCSTPWSYTTARNVSYEDSDGFRVTEEILEDMITGAETEMQREAVDAEHIKGDLFEIVERSTVKYSVNDYAVTNPLEFAATSLGLTHIAGLVPSELFDAIQEIHTKFFPKADLKVHTFMFTLYCVLHDLFPASHSLLAIDVNAETTEYAIIEDGLLTENFFTMIGSNTFIRDTMQTTGKPASDIQSLMSTETGTTHIDSSSINASIASYKDTIKSMVVKIGATKVLPHTIVLTAQSPYEHFFASILIDTLEAELKTSPHVLDLVSALSQNNNTSATADVYMLVLAQFFHKSHKCGERITP
jgi:hypothetical protein